jgi:adenylate cyclase
MVMEKDVAIMMADLTGYTAMTEAHGGASAAKMVGKYMELVDRALVGTSRIHQRIGDQVVILADNAVDLLETARLLNQFTSDEHHFLSIHAGLHYGPVFIEGTNLFGSTINISARIMNLAQRGQILCSQIFMKQLNDVAPATSIGKHKLKNVVGEFELFALTETTNKSIYIDPVCRMQINFSQSELSVKHNNSEYHFCSTHCRDRFLADPEAFIAAL